MKKHSMFRKNINRRFLWRLRGFSLIELLISITIIATLIGLALPNFLGARSRAKDSRIKSEMNQIKSALQLYLNDYKVYPLKESGGIGKINYIAGCGASGTTLCPATCSVAFAAGGTGCETVYMTKFPNELGSSMFYYSDGTNYCLKVTLENASDSDIASSKSKCNTLCTSFSAPMTGSKDFAVCSE